ncbi:hypothetical protein SynA1560_02683 [Synechococcus sp. A15-60]|nr:hypothetical protein SynA1560_02683 [Synechococcus sp. A15-60]
MVVDGGLQQLQKRFQHSRLGAQVGAVECPKHNEQHYGKTSSRTMTTELIVQDDILGLIARSLPSPLVSKLLVRVEPESLTLAPDGIAYGSLASQHP